MSTLIATKSQDVDFVVYYELDQDVPNHGGQVFSSSQFLEV